jgi:hypothetical protein
MLSDVGNDDTRSEWIYIRGRRMVWMKGVTVASQTMKGDQR